MILKNPLCKVSKAQLTQPGQVRRFLVRLINRCMEGRLDTQFAIDMSRVCTVLLKAMEAASWQEQARRLQREIEALKRSGQDQSTTTTNTTNTSSANTPVEPVDTKPIDTNTSTDTVTSTDNDSNNNTVVEFDKVVNWE